MHNPDVHIEARYLMHLPIGNTIPLCVDCCAWWRADAAESGDEMSQPVWIRSLNERPRRAVNLPAA